MGRRRSYRGAQFGRSSTAVGLSACVSPPPRQVQEGAEGGLEVVEEPPLDMEKINAQSLRLSKLILLIGFSALLYLVWSDLLAVLGYLDQVSLWNAAEGDLVDNALSISDFVTALLVVAITFISARKLPGLLEVMVLSRLALSRGVPMRLARCSPTPLWAPVS